MNTICVLVGTDHHAFGRLVDWADLWAARHPEHRVLVQYGYSQAPTRAQGVAFLDPMALVAVVEASDVVVTHGGPGTLMSARARGRLPVMVPRDPAHHEHVDGHQIRFSRWVEEKGLARVVRHIDRLDLAVQGLLDHPVEVAGGSDPLEAPYRLAALVEAAHKDAEHVSGRHRGK